MQTSRKPRPNHTQTPSSRSAYSSYRKADNRVTLIVLGALCLFVPPLGIFLTWRTQNVDLSMRAIFSGVGAVATTLLFFFLMRPDPVQTSISPTPATPQLVGYGAVADQAVPVVPEAPAQPAAPAAPAPGATEVPAVSQEPGELTDDTIVYAVTNNAASYHLYEICEQQENRRPLTLRDALNEGLQPCEKCVGAMG